jgi:hypothetical protein
MFEWYTILAAAVLVWLLVVLERNVRRRYPQFSLTEIGAIQMEIADCRPSGVPSPKTRQRVMLIILGLFILVYLAGAFYDLLSHSGDTGKALLTFAVKVCGALAYGLMMYVSSLGGNFHLVVAEGGLFLLVDPSRPWLRASDAFASNPRLCSRKLYGWDKIERFHWTRHRRKGYALHLSVDQPNFSFPQMISFELPSLSDSQQQELDQILHEHVVSPAESHHPVTV